jgi:group I intron endonuclease
VLIYCVRNLINNKEYIGMTTRALRVRWKQHIADSNRIGSWEWDTPLGRAIRKYGEDTFSVSVIMTCNSVAHMKMCEIASIEERGSHTSVNGYNVTKGGDGRFGMRLSQEVKDKIGASRKGKKVGEIGRANMRAAKKDVFKLSGHPKARTIIVNGEETFYCLKEFTNKYNLKYSSVVSSLARNNGKTTFKNFLVEAVSNE